MLLLAWLITSVDATCNPEGFDAKNANLDMARWRVHANPAVDTARQNRAFGAYKFSTTDGTETFPVAFGMVEGWPWPHRCDPAKYRRLHATVPVSYTHLRAHETLMNLVCRLLLEKKKLMEY